LHQLTSPRLVRHRRAPDSLPEHQRPAQDHVVPRRGQVPGRCSCLRHRDERHHPGVPEEGQEGDRDDRLPLQAGVRLPPTPCCPCTWGDASPPGPNAPGITCEQVVEQVGRDRRRCPRAGHLSPARGPSPGPDRARNSPCKQRQEQGDSGKRRASRWPPALRLKSRADAVRFPCAQGTAQAIRGGPRERQVNPHSHESAGKLRSSMPGMNVTPRRGAVPGAPRSRRRCRPGRRRT
jgi:hypothetical protein